MASLPTAGHLVSVLTRPAPKMQLNPLPSDNHKAEAATLQSPVNILSGWSRSKFQPSIRVRQQHEPHSSEGQTFDVPKLSSDCKSEVWLGSTGDVTYTNKYPFLSSSIGNRLQCLVFVEITKASTISVAIDLYVG